MDVLHGGQRISTRISTYYIAHTTGRRELGLVLVASLYPTDFVCYFLSPFTLLSHQLFLPHACIGIPPGPRPSSRPSPTLLPFTTPVAGGHPLVQTHRASYQVRPERSDSRLGRHSRLYEVHLRFGHPSARHCVHEPLQKSVSEVAPFQLCRSSSPHTRRDGGGLGTEHGGGHDTEQLIISIGRQAVRWNDVLR